MNKLIKKQLEKCERCKLPPYDESSTLIFIPKQIPKKDPEFEKDKCFLICIDDYILNPPEGFTLAKNWNGNTNPPAKYMNICVVQVMGKMVKVEGVGFDINLGVTLPCYWIGWLPMRNVKIMEEI